MSSTELVAQLVNRVVAPWKARVLSMVGRALLEVANDATGIQVVKIGGLKDEVLEDIPHMQPGGLTHYAQAGAEGVLLAVGGDRDNAVVVSMSNRSGRPTGGEEGETVLYSLGTQATIRIKPDGSVVVHAPGDVSIAGSVAIDGDVTVTGAVSADGEVTAMASTTITNLSTHMHPTPTGPSGPPTPGT